MLDLRSSEGKRTRGVILPPLPPGKTVRILTKTAPSAPTSLKEVYQKHAQVSRNSISRGKDT